MAYGLIISFLIILCLPQDAHAWGAATHLELSQSILRNTSALAPGIAAIITKFSYDFLYGSISADIVVGKNFVEELKHCHNWRFGRKLLKKAESDSQRAFAYGYLSHLAADTIAHNHFIPEMMIRSFSTRIHRHIYWELRFDALADRRVWDIPNKIVRSVHRDNDSLLKSTLEDTPFSFITNKVLFSSMLSLHRVDKWHRMLGLLSNKSRWKLHKKDKDKYFAITLDAVKDILTHGGDAKCTIKDPTGKINLQRANAERKKLKTIKKNGRDWAEDLKKALEGIAL